MRYRRDVPRDDPDVIEATILHVREHISACCDPDDDEHALADAVRIEVTEHVDGDPALVSIIGEIDAQPDAAYLRSDYQPTDGDPGDELPAALDHEPVDLDEEQFERHMTAKEQWR